MTTPFNDTPPNASKSHQAQDEAAAEYAIEQSLLPGKTLSHTFIKQARRSWFKSIASDTLGTRVSYGKLFIGSLLLANRLKRPLKDQKHVGIFMPSSVGNVLINLALTLSGKISINLNWTASTEAQQSAVTQAHIGFVITSRRFTKKVKHPDLPVHWLYIEDLLENLRRGEKFRAIMSALFASPAQIAGGRTPEPSDTVTIIFSSGSTGTPKGVVLSHSNILSNVESGQLIQQFKRSDSVCGILPIFHAFGYLGLLWWPLLQGMRIAYHPNPTDNQRVVQLIKEEQLTVLLSTPTFLQNYMRKATLEDFTSLKTIITGGEKLRSEIADLCEDTFNIRPLEGYGCTELSPLALLNPTNDSRSGSAGQPIPGVAIRIVHPETREPLAYNEEGLMLIKGPNVMQGYYNQQELTDSVLQNRWYNTGDIARMDAHNFVYITGRLSRFSKIAGEMIPHGAVEEALQQATGTDHPCVAVVSMPCPVKGEQLAVCHTEHAGDPNHLIAKLRHAELPNLWIPRASNFYSIPELPLLGTGKLDLHALKKVVNNDSN